MNLFVSAGEPSGDLHGANLIRSLKRLSPGLEVVGLGGPRMAAAGARLHYPLTDLAVMWFGRALAHLPTFFRIARQAEVYFRSARPAAVVLIDYPGFHWALAKRAHRAGIPVYYFVPPQLWAWMGWRVRKMQRWVHTVLTALPFEDEWYRSRGVRTHHVGHPYFDELVEQHIDRDYVAVIRQGGSPVVGLLPGSRGQEVQANFPQMLSAAAKIRESVPEVRFHVASFNDRQAAMAREYLAGTGLPITVHVGRTPEVIESADVCVAVSGSVGLELMYREKPTAVVYRVTRSFKWLADRLKTCRYISLVNLLADEEIFPEFASAEDASSAIAAQIVSWLRNGEARAKVVDRLRQVRDQTARPGACDRAAEFLIREIAHRGRESPSQLRPTG